MKKLFLLSLFSVLSFAQGTLSLVNPSPSASGYAPGAVVTLNVVKAGNPTDAAIQLQLSAVGVASVAVAPGPALPAGKFASCSSTLPLTCVLIGLDQNVIPDGVVATLNVTLATPFPGGSVTLANVIEADTLGNSLAVSIANPTVSLPAPDRCDVNGDGTVGSADLSAVILAIVNGSPFSAVLDLNSDTVVNVLDAQIVSAAAVTGTCSAH